MSALGSLALASLPLAVCVHSGLGFIEFPMTPLANDEAHALYHGYACSESTSASLRPKFTMLPCWVGVFLEYSTVAHLMRRRNTKSEGVAILSRRRFPFQEKMPSNN